MNRREFLKNSLAAAMAVTALGGASLLSGAEEKTKTASGRKGKMKILVLTGSPRKNGNSGTLGVSPAPFDF